MQCGLDIDKRVIDGDSKDETKWDVQVYISVLLLRWWGVFEGRDRETDPCVRGGEFSSWLYRDGSHALLLRFSRMSNTLTDRQFDFLQSCECRWRQIWNTHAHGLLHRR